jgi:hypothetical protein
LLCAASLITHSQIANNALGALRANGSGTRILVGGSTITNSGTASQRYGEAQINTFGDNVVIGNASKARSICRLFPRADLFGEEGGVA